MADGTGADGSPARSRGVAATFSRGIARIAHLENLLQVERVVAFPSDRQHTEVDRVVGWGHKGTAARASAYAKRHGLPLLRVEDGFLRSVGLASRREGPLSVVIDDQGMYYDAAAPSRLETLILAAESESEPLRGALRARARRCIAAIVEHQLSKYNHSPIALPALPKGPLVLVADQTAGDISVERGLLHPGGFQAMLTAALDENPGATIVVKTHPDVIAGKKAGYLTQLARDARVCLLGAPANPIALMQAVDRVYVCTSQLGFEAVLAGKRVTCFGAPFYAGWGLTDDRVAIARRGVARSLEDVFAAAYIRYPNYIDPETGAPSSIERVIEHLALQRRMFRENRGTIYCIGFQFWKRPYIRKFLRSPGNKLVFLRSDRHAARVGLEPGARVLVWGQRMPELAARASAQLGTPLLRMEDGFLRSAGLGSDLVAPASLVIDDLGIYYDPARPSALEQILATISLGEGERAQAEALRRAIVSRAVSKYNVGTQAPLVFHGARRIVLVPGQVEDDASIQRGCVDVRTNLGLLEAVRRRCPEAFIVWKPHPDVTSGNRVGEVPERDARRLCDAVVRDASLPVCLAAAHEVHTMTSLAGFEALLRGLPVTVYGLPFYAGWGLTEDLQLIARRTRRLSLDELVSGTLIRYPRYVSMKTGCFTTPEVILEQLAAERARVSRGGFRVPLVTGPWRKLVHVWRGLTDVA